MATQAKVIEKLRSLELEPLENSCIVIQHGASNIGERIARFLINQEPFYVLQLCENELVFAPMDYQGHLSHEEELLTIPFSNIKEVSVKRNTYSYQISITCFDGEIELVTDANELSLFLNSGKMLSTDNIWGTRNWHEANLEGTLAKLENLGTAVQV